MGIRMLLELFINNTSMRGFGKCYKTKSLFLKIMWTVYIVSMIITLLTSSYFLILEYFSFFTTMQDSERFQDFTNFPAITICSQQPLGPNAQEFWNNGSILSPKTLSNNMRKSMLSSFKSGNKYTAKDLFFADKLTTYYQNIAVDDLSKIGLQEKDMIVFCMQRHARNNNPSVSHDEVCKCSVRKVRHPQYLNCYELLLDPKDSPQIHSVSLILQSGFKGDEADADLQAHYQVHDLFTQAMGLRITLHQPGHFPEINKYGFNIPIKTSTEVKYQIVNKEMLDLGDEHNCVADKDIQSKPLVDLHQHYKYSQAGCISENIGKEIFNQCKCISFFHLIFKHPTNETPYCFKYDSENIETIAHRLNCVRNLKLKEAQSQFIASLCPKRCNVTYFRVEASPSPWQPTYWQLLWVVKVSTAWDKIEGNQKELTQAESDLLEFMETDNLTQVEKMDVKVNLDKLSLVTISRLSYNTVHKIETLQITLSALLARIGGLGSLTIGCTLAIGFELVEFLFLFAQKFKERANKKAGQNKEETDNGAVEIIPLTKVVSV